MSNDALLEILRNEYGITTSKDLDNAIRSLPVIDLTPFKGEVINKEEKEAYDLFRKGETRIRASV